MANFDAFGAPQFGLHSAYIASWTSSNTYGTPVQIPSVQMLGAILKIVSAMLEGDDQITATAARASSAEARLRFGSVSIAALEIMLGNASLPSGSTPNRYDNLRVAGGDNMPYFGLCGRALAEEGVGDFHVWLPKVRIMQDVELASMNYGQFVIPELTVTCINDGSWGILNLIEHETATDVDLPPTVYP